MSAPTQEYPAQIAAAQRALQVGELDSARKLLSATAPEQRGFEYRWLEAFWITASESRTPLDPRSLALRSPSLGLAFAPDGSRLASAHQDGSVQLWDASTWEPLARWSGAGDPAAVLALSWSSDGARLASASSDGSLAIWDAWTLEALQCTKLDSTIQNIQVAARADVWLLSRDDQRVTLVETKDWRTRWTSAPLPAGIQALCIAPEGGRLALSCADRSTHLWRMQDGHELWKSTRRGGSALLFGPDGQRLWVAGTSLDSLRIADGADLGQLDCGPGPFTQLAYSAQAQRLALAGPQLVLVDTQRSQVTWRSPGPDSAAQALAWNPKREELVVAHATPELRVYRPLPAGQQHQELAKARELRQQAQAWWLQQQAEGARAVDTIQQLAAERSLSAEVKLARLAVLTAALGSK